MPNNLMYVMNGGNLHKVHHPSSQPDTMASVTLENQSLKADNDQLRTRLDSKMFEVTKLRNKLKDMGSELESYKQLVAQIRNQFASCNGNQHSLSLAIENANVALANIAKRKPTKTKKIKSNSSTSNCSCCSALEKPYVCDWVNCGKRFRQKPHLEAHKNIHTGRRFICEFPNCGKSFVRKYNLQEHQKLHSSSANLCSYPDCGKVFSSKYSLTRHQNAQHNLNL